MKKRDWAKMVVIACLIILSSWVVVQVGRWLTLPVVPYNSEMVKSLTRDMIDLRTKVDILTGKLNAYESMGVRMDNRIDILEGRYDNLSILQRSVDGDKKEVSTE